MNKKLVSIVLSAATLASSAAFAVDFNPQFYVGGELQAGVKKGVKKLNTKAGDQQKSTVVLTGQTKKKTPVSPIQKSASGASLFVGSRLTENFGLELGGSMLRTQKTKNIKNFAQGSAVSIKNRNVYADAMGYIPIDCALDLIGSVGVGHLSTKVKGKMVAKPTTAADRFSAKSSKMGVRVGLGAQYKVTDNISARLMVRHQQGNKIVKSVTSTGLGMFYQF